MTEVDYQHECCRAELLGIPKPSREEFFAKHRETTEGNVEEEEEEVEMNAERAEDSNVTQEGFRRIGGGLDELNSILSSTQKKLNRFKTVCGSLTNLLKIPVGSSKKVNPDVETENTTDGGEKKSTTESPPPQVIKGEDSQLGKLESLITKAERAELSLSSQNKQMKKFLN